MLSVYAQQLAARDSRPNELPALAFVANLPVDWPVQALALLQAGQETYSDQLLTQLGCTWRLSSALLQHAEAPVAPQPADIACEHSAGACTAGHNSPCQPVHIFCNILPGTQ